jgi:hypothetical protein
VTADLINTKKKKKMEGGNEQRVAITFCFKAGLSATETLVLVQRLMGMRL